MQDAASRRARTRHLGGRWGGEEGLRSARPHSHPRHEKVRLAASWSRLLWSSSGPSWIEGWRAMATSAVSGARVARAPASKGRSPDASRAFRACAAPASSPRRNRSAYRSALRVEGCSCCSVPGAARRSSDSFRIAAASASDRHACPSKSARAGGVQGGGGAPQPPVSPRGAGHRPRPPLPWAGPGGSRRREKRGSGGGREVGQKGRGGLKDYADVH